MCELTVIYFKKRATPVDPFLDHKNNDLQDIIISIITIIFGVINCSDFTNFDQVLEQINILN